MRLEQIPLWLLAFALTWVSCGVADERERQVLPVWPGTTVSDFGDIGPERVREPDEAPTPDATWITNVTRPTLTVFSPPSDRNTGVAIIICPGGGYWNLAIDLEGDEVAEWLNQQGITGCVLKYRVPRRPGQPEPLPAPGPLFDAQRAVSLVRSRAAELRIDPQRIGIIGFSAGGHLAVMTATHFDRRSYEPIDDIDRVSCRPDFAIVVYPGYLLPEDTDTHELAPYIRIPEQTPPMFLVHASDDTESGPEHSACLYLALRAHGVPAELHIYSEGEHGFGVRPIPKPVSTWTDRCLDWLRQQEILPTVDATRDFGVDPLPEGRSGLAERYPADKGISEDPAVIFHENFETGHPSDRWDMSYHARTTRLVEDPTLVHQGRRSLEFTVPQQRDELSNAVVKVLEPARDTVFLRYYSRFDPGFDQLGSSHNGGYLAAISDSLDYATPGIRADGHNKFVASFENWREDPTTRSPGRLNVYCYHPQQRSEYGDHFFPTGEVLPFSYRPGEFGPQFTPRPDVIPELGRWYCYELMLHANTPGRKDGRIACWVDGSLVADFPHLRLRDTDALKINYAALDLHIGSNRVRSNQKWYDDVVIATSYIGPMVMTD